MKLLLVCAVLLVAAIAGTVGYPKDWPVSKDLVDTWKCDNDGDCNPGKHCYDGLCQFWRSQPSLRGRCASNDTCGHHQFCDDGMCRLQGGGNARKLNEIIQPSLRAEGTPCTTGADCTGFKETCANGVCHVPGAGAGK